MKLSQKDRKAMQALSDAVHANGLASQSVDVVQCASGRTISVAP